MDYLKNFTKSHLLGNPTRLAIMIYLLPRESVLFTDLQEVLDITPGKLDSNIRKLKTNGYVETRRVLKDRPRTLIVITEKGSQETVKYIEELKRVLDYFPEFER